MYTSRHQPHTCICWTRAKCSTMAQDCVTLQSGSHAAGNRGNHSFDAMLMSPMLPVLVFATAYCWRCFHHWPHPSQVQRARTAYLTRLRQQGDPSDPFERVRRQQEHEQQHTRRLHAGSGSYQLQGQQSQQQANGGALSLIMPGGGAGV